jgi:hypothetical protein
VLERGKLLIGTVKDEKGNPVAGAEVLIGESFFGRTAAAKTNKQGVFSLKISKHINHRGITISARAKGRAPDTKTISEREGIPPQIELVLKPPQTIRGIVVNEKGEPLPKTWFAVESWKGVSDFVGSETRKETDKHGRFEIKDAPEDEVLFAFSQKGYAALAGFPLKAGAENKVVLLPPTQVSGKVVDADTGEQIKNYTIDRGFQWRKERPKEISWDGSRRNSAGYNEIKIDKDGIFQNELNWTHVAYFYRVSAKGYYTASSAPVKMDGKKHELVIKLHKGKEFVLKIVDANGQPVAHAEVLFQNKMRAENFDGFSFLRFQNGKLLSDVEKKFTTDASGFITIPPQAEEFRLVIAHDLGRATISSKELNTQKLFVLSPWECIKGKSFIGTKPNAGAKIFYRPTEYYGNQTIDSFPSDYIRWDATAIADKNGNFEIKYAIPNLANINDEIQWKKIRVIRGEVLNVQLGGKGRIVVGKIVLSDAIKDKRIRGGNIELADTPEKKLKANIATKASGTLKTLPERKPTRAEKDKADFDTYEENKKLRRQDFTVNSANTFLLKNVLPGKYTLTIPASGIPTHQTLIIPPDPDGTLVDVPLVLPTIELKPSRFPGKE